MTLTLINPPLTEAQNKTSHQANTPQYGGTLAWGTTNEPTIINPILTSHSVSAALMELIFDSLVRIDSDGNIVPGLAESWEISENKLEYTFHLKKDVRFHDGVECTSEDVKFTYDSINDPKNQSPWRTNTELVERWEVIDTYTLKMVLQQPFVPILYKLVREIVPQHLLENQDLQSASFNYYPIGTGPFKFKQWDRETNQIELEANQDYFEGRPYLDRITVKTYPDNTSLWASFMRGEVDFVKYLNYEDYMVLEKDPAFKAYKIPWEMYCALVYNPKDSLLFDLEIRKAIAHGINVEELMKTILPGGIKSTGPFHPKSEGFNPEVQPLEYNPIKARMMLMHRGWQDRDEDGIFEKGGRELELRILVDTRSDYYKKMATVIRQQLSEIGIKVQLLLYKDENELTKEYMKEYKPQAWLRFFEGLGFGGYGPTRSWYSLSSEFGKLWNYKNKEVDRLFEFGRSAEDPATRNLTYKQIHEIVYKDQPACFLFFPMSFHAVSAKFKNTNEFFCGYMPDHSIKDWYASN